MKKANVGGVVSEGMLCDERMLGLCGNQDLQRVRPESPRRLLAIDATMSVPHRSTEPAQPRHRREMTIGCTRHWLISTQALGQERRDSRVLGDYDVGSQPPSQKPRPKSHVASIAPIAKGEGLFEKKENAKEEKKARAKAEREARKAARPRRRTRPPTTRPSRRPWMYMIAIDAPVRVDDRRGREGGKQKERALPPLAVAGQALDIAERQLAGGGRGLAELAADRRGGSVALSSWRRTCACRWCRGWG